MDLAQGVSSSSIEKLNGRNYATWRFKVQVYLKTKGWYKVITDPVPVQEEEYVQWCKLDGEALNVIVQTIDMDQVIYVINENTAKGAWMKLEEQHMGDYEDRRISLGRELSNSQWRKGDDVTKYVTRIERIGASLQTMGQVISPAELSSYVLNGLPEEFRNVKRIFEAMKPSDMTPIRIKRALLNEESTIKSNSSHEAYQIRRETREIGPCFVCGKQGHLKRDCWYNSTNRSKISPTKPKNLTTASRYKPGKRVNNVKNENKHHIMTVKNKMLSEDEWIIDSGASCHITNNIDIVSGMVPAESEEVTVADGTTQKTVGVGLVPLTTTDNNKRRNILLTKVLCAPGLNGNLISVSRLDELGMRVSFQNGKCKVYKEENLLLTANRRNGLYYANVEEKTVEREEIKKTEIKEVKNYKKEEISLWHRRLGHTNNRKIILMEKNKVAKGIKVKGDDQSKCECCVQGKCTKDDFKVINETTRTSELLELVHMDIIGPIAPESIGGARYILTIVDDFSRKVFVFHMRTKDETEKYIKLFITRAERETGKRVRRIRTDNGREFVNRTLDIFYESKGIKHETTIPYTPEQNGIAERCNRTLIEMTRTMLIDAGLPENFWGEAMATAAYLKNRIITKNMPDKTPFETWTGRRPTLSHLRVFGSLAHGWVPKMFRKKFEPKTFRGIMVGYFKNKRAYRIYDTVQRIIVAVKRPHFFEFRKGAELLEEEHQRSERKNKEAVIYDLTQGKDDIEKKNGRKDRKTEKNDRENKGQVLDQEGKGEDRNRELEGKGEEQELREKGQDQEIQDQDTEDKDQGEKHKGSEDSQRGTRKRKQTKRLQIQPKLKTYCNLMGDSKVIEPKTYEEATRDENREKWVEAINEELKSLKTMNVWKVVKREEGMRTLNSKWVFTLKRINEREKKFKARLVANGYYQEKGLDYAESFSPVLKLTSLRMIMSIANEKDMKLRQLDIKTAYLNGDLKEEVFMELPKGYETKLSRDKFVCKLEKSLYGLKQSGRTWNQKLDVELKNIGLKRQETDRCIYTKKEGNDFVIVGVYVDDFILAGSSEEILERTVNDIKRKFEVRDMGEPDIILGIKIKRDKEKGIISLNQEHYIEELLRKYGMLESATISTPMEMGLKLERSDRPINEKIPYQPLIGSLMYLVQGTRPDIGYAVHYLSQFNDCYNETHWKHLKRILRYLKLTKEECIQYTKGGNKDLTGYSDASWNPSNDGKSVTGYIYFIGNGPVCWRSSKQQIIALSTCESEYIAVCEAIKEGNWLLNMLKELEMKKDFLRQDTVRLYCDNQATISVANNAQYCKRTKHIELKYLYVRNELEEKKFDLIYLTTKNMIADIMTKALSKEKIQKIRDLIKGYREWENC